MTRAAPVPIETILEDFAFLEEWEDRYRYLIELGRKFDPLPDSARTAENKVQGCASQVWLVTEVGRQAGRPVLSFAGDSDALIVKGLVAIALALFSGKTTDEIGRVDAESVFARLGLSEHLSTQRSNGLRSLVARIRAEARSAAERESASLPN